MGKAIAIEGCTILANEGAITGTFQIQTQADSNVSLPGGSCYFGDMTVIVMAGAVYGSMSLASPVTINITATGSNATTSKGNALLLGDHSSGADKGTFVQEQTSTQVAITLKISDAGQTDVTVD